MNQQGFREIFKMDGAGLKTLNDTLRALWKKVMGHVEVKDLSDAAQAVINSKAGSEEVATRFAQTEESIRLEAERATGAEEELKASIDVQAGQIELAVSRTVGGTNLIRSEAGRVSVVAGSVSGKWEKSSYCQGELAVVMAPWSGAHNLVRYHSDVEVIPGEYTLSFWCWRYGTDTVPVIRPNLYYDDPNVDIYFDQYSFEPVANTPTRYEIVLNVEYTGTVDARFVTMTPWTVGEVYITDVKLERGNTATAWSPNPQDPAYCVDTRSGIVINEQGVYVEGAEIDLRTTTEDEHYLNITSEGILASNLRAPNVAVRYDGPGTIYVRPGAATDPENGVYGTLIEAFKSLNNRNLDGSVSIQVEGDTYGYAELTGVCGGAHGVTIWGNGHTLTGCVRAANCPVRIVILDLKMIYDPAHGTDYAASMDNCTNIELYGCTVNGNSTAPRGLLLRWGTRATVDGCEFYNVTDSAIKAGNNVDLLALNLKGDSPYFLWGDGAVVKWQGTRPGGSYWEGYPTIVNTDLNALTVDYGSATPTIQPPKTVEYPMLHADSYAGGYENSWDYQNHDDIMQGYTEHAGRIFGCIWFDNAAIRSAVGGRTVKQATLRLKAQTYIGRGVAVEVHLWGTTTEYSGRSGAPAQTKDYGVIGTATPGEATTISIPTDAAADLAGGAINGLMLYSDDAELYKDRNYSKNYMRFDGGTKGDEGTRPVLTVTYE